MNYTSSRVEEFFNHHHARSTGRFASGSTGGLFSVAKTSKKMPKLFKARSSRSSFLSREKRISPTMRNRRGMIFSAETEEFYNSNHSPTDGKFSGGSRGGTYSQRTPRPLEGRFAHMSDSQLARSGLPAHKRELEARKQTNTNVFLSAKIEEFYNRNHSSKDGRFATGQRTTMPKTPYGIMKARESRQGKLAQTNRARANHGMPPIQN